MFGNLILLLCSVVTGVLTSARRDELDTRYNWIVLRAETRSVTVATREDQHPLERLRTLLDGELAAEGCFTTYSDWRKHLGKFLSAKSLSLVHPPRPDPFAAPPFASIGQFHRQRISGRVIAVREDDFFLRTSSNGCIRVLPVDAAPNPSPGNLVTVVGFAELDPFNLQFFNALVRLEDNAPPDEPPTRLDMKDLFTNVLGHHAVYPMYHGCVISVSGTVRDRPSAVSAGALELDSDGHAVTVDLSALPKEGLERLVPGCRLEATGLCLAEFEQTSVRDVTPRFRRFVLVPRTVDDLRIVRRAPWWTPTRLIAVIATLCSVLVLTLVWNRMLTIRSERRGRALYEERFENAKAHLKVSDRTRLAIELHDAISQSLTGIAFQTDSAISAEGGRDPAVARHLSTARNLLESCRRELRGCLWDLRTRTFAEKDLTEAVTKALVPESARARIGVRFNVPRARLSEATTHTVLRITRELVSNAVRHGKAANIRVAGELEDGFIRFSVKDDGRGFDPATAPGPADGHFGIQGIRERLQSFGGDLEIRSEAGRGTEARVRLRAEKDDDDE